MPNGVQTGAQDTTKLAVEAMLREYDVLRAEIALYHQQRERFSLVGVVFAPAFYALFGTGLPENELIRRLLFLGFALLVMLSGIAFFDRSFRVKRIARYLHSDLRHKLSELTGGFDVWRWEIFKKSFHQEAGSRGRLLLRTLDMIRIAPFFLAFAALLFLYFQDVGGWRAFGCTLWEKVLIGLNIAFFLVFLLAIPGIQETTGASHEESFIKKIFRWPRSRAGR